MGSQSGVVICGLVAAITAFVLNAIALGTPDWIVGHTFNHSSAALANHTNVTTKGLWSICVEGNCTSLVGVKQSDWFLAAQILCTLDVAANFACVLFYYMFYSTNNYNTHQRVSYWLIGFSTFAWISSVAVLISFGLRQDDETREIVDPVVGWSYWMAVSGAVFAFISAILIYYECFLLRKSRRPYYDL